MAKRKFTKLEQIGIIVALGIMGVFFYLKQVYDPAVEKYTAYRKKLNSLSAAVNKLKEGELAAQGVENLEKRVKAKERELKKAEKVLVRTDADARKIITSVMNIAERRRLVVTGYNRPDAEALKIMFKSLLYKRRYYDLHLAGTYDNLLRTLVEINKLPQLVTIERVHISRQPTEAESQLDINLLVSI